MENLPEMSGDALILRVTSLVVTAALSARSIRLAVARLGCVSNLCRWTRPLSRLCHSLWRARPFTQLKARLLRPRLMPG